MDNSRPVRHLDDLLEVFHQAEKPPSQWRIGVESEKFGVTAKAKTPVGYGRAESAEQSIEEVFARLVAEYGYHPIRESERGPIIAVARDGLSVTLEPGAQLELSGAPWSSLHQVVVETEGHFSELLAISQELDIEWLATGFHPLARLDELPTVPKVRYPIMREYLPRSGSRALDMMWRSATVQVNLDFESEREAMRKLVLALKLSPVAHAITANAPFYEGRVSSRISERGDVWLHMPPDRSGLLPSLWRQPGLGYRDYAEWALDAGMFLFKREGRLFKNTGQTFRDFWQNGFAGERATVADWLLHLNTLFPEVRLKNTLELRACDCLPLPLMHTVAALFVGLLYDSRAVEEAERLVFGLDYETVEHARPELVTRGYGATLGGKPLEHWSEALLSIARAGLERRAVLDERGRDETVVLQPLERLVAARKTPAEMALEGLRVGDDVPRAELVCRTRLAGRTEPE